MDNSDRCRVVITAVEVLSPLGGNSEQTCAAIRAGMSEFTEYPYYSCTPKDPEWEERLPLYAGMVPAVYSGHTGVERFVNLAMPPLSAMIDKAKLTRRSLAKTGLLIALPQLDAATQPLGLHSEFLPQLLKRTGLNVKTANVGLEGRVGVFSQIREAIFLLQEAELDQCIVGGVDSYIMNERLSLLDDHWRLKSGRNVDGFIPGEAATMLMLETEQHAQNRGATPLAVLSGLGTGIEPEAIASEKASTGQGLAEAIGGALAEKPEQYKIEKLYSDFNGESCYAFEVGLTMTRMATLFEASEGVCHPADCYGDIGSASGGVLVAYAIDSFQKQAGTAQSALLWTCSDSGSRMAVLLEAAPSR